MKKSLSALLAFTLCLTMPVATPAEAATTNDLIVSARVVSPYEVALKAPVSGDLDFFTLREGDAVKGGASLLTILPQKAYAEVDGTVAAIYAQPGDSADGVVTRFGSVVTIEHVNRYEINADCYTGYNSTINRNPYVGTKVYLRSVNKKHFADGMITSVSGRKFTVAVSDGDLVFTEKVKIYREAEYEDETLLARATLSVVPPYIAKASGTVISMDVAVGDAVKAGDQLFTYVPDVLDSSLRGKADANVLKAADDLIISKVHVAQGASVQKDEVLLTAYPASHYQLMGQVEEKDVARLALGDTVNVRFEELDLGPVQGTVASLSPLGTEEDTSRYTVYFDFEAPQGVLLGMHATVEK